MITRVAVPAAVVVTALLAGCAHEPVRRSSASAPVPALPKDISLIPDAVPRVEPRSRSGNPAFYEVFGRRYAVLASSSGYVERGVASWYGPGFHGVNTAMGEPYDMLGMTAAHKTLPLPTYARVTNLANGRSVIVRINDRGPFVDNRIIDLSYTAAAKLDMIRSGTAFVEVRALDPGTPLAEPLSQNVAPVITGSDSAAPAVITAPAPATAAVPALGDLAPQALYIQVGAFGDQANAARALQRLQAAGIADAFSLPTQSNGQSLRRIRVGPIASVEQYDALIARLAALGFPQARLAQD